MDLFKVNDYPSVNVLGITYTKTDELKAAHHSNDQQEAAVVRYWLLQDPLASWRRIINQLDYWAYIAALLQTGYVTMLRS